MGSTLCNHSSSLLFKKRREFAKISPSRRTPPIPWASISQLRWVEDYQRWGGGGAPPLGAFNPPPHLGGQRRARLELGIFGMISKFFFEILRPKFVPLSLFLSPQGPPGTANPAPKSGKVCFFRFLYQFVCVPKRTSILISKKHRKICEKQRFWDPKPLPKPLQNQCKIDVPKNMSSLIDFCLICSFVLIFDFLKISVSPRREHYF